MLQPLQAHGVGIADALQAQHGVTQIITRHPECDLRQIPVQVRRGPEEQLPLQIVQDEAHGRWIRGNSLADDAIMIDHQFNAFQPRSA